MALKKTSRKITRIIVHCSATPDGKDFTVQDIDRWHMQKGYDCIGYHYVVYRDGSVHEGRDINRVGAHCSGYNTGSIGVCYIGGMDAQNKMAKDTRTDKQKAALWTLLRELVTLYPDAEIYGHRNFAAKECPSFDARKEYKGM